MNGIIQTTITNLAFLPANLRFIADKLLHAENMTSLHVQNIIREANVTAEDLMPWADFDHPTSDSYGRQLVYSGEKFEIMVMSWTPGDYSAMHDHGYTTWGAVKVFGPAEHAVGAHDIDRFVTLSRIQLDPGKIIAVSHDLVHQMGNPSDKCFLSLHIYGNSDRSGMITGNARVFDFCKGEVQRTDSGVFYSLPENKINSRELAPKADYYTFLFDTVQNLLRCRKAEFPTDKLLSELTSEDHWQQFKEDIVGRIDEHGHIVDSRYWIRLFDILKQAATLQCELMNDYSDDNDINWQTYAPLYDYVIGTTNHYILGYLTYAFEKYEIDVRNALFADIGCGTGWLEPILAQQLGMTLENLIGFDPSPAMLEVARKRTNVELAGLLDLNESMGQFDITFCNSYQYLAHEDFDEAVRRIASITKLGGLCISEFITPDHIRWYPNVVFSESDQVISLRQLSLYERGGVMYQESEIINLNRLDGMRISYEGTHHRFLLSAGRIREVFHKYFGESFTIIDGKSFVELSPEMETCTSTRFVVLAKRGL